jgi:predicted glycoside hydrolase/deacetylase ChbG (UPF0249 family)/aminoglycoside phosphotransferase (APT) family kinase protein
MTLRNHEWRPLVADDDVQQAIERDSEAVFGRPRHVERVLRRELSPYSTSFAIEEIDLLLDGGEALHLVFKNLGPEASVSDGPTIRPSFMYRPDREILLYRNALKDAGLGTAVCYGTVVDAQAGRYWLFLERLNAAQLRHVGDPEIFDAAARWLARLHTSLDRMGGSTHSSLPISKYDRAFYERWLHRFKSLAERVENKDSGLFQRVAGFYDRAIDQLLQLPTTLIHGEFYPSNVLVQDAAGNSRRICPIDWETAAIGPPAIDLAALVAGDWSDSARDRMVSAYADEMTRLDARPLLTSDFATTLDLCRLHQAVQWVAWSESWQPPPDQSRDWLGEASRLIDTRLSSLSTWAPASHVHRGQTPSAGPQAPAWTKRLIVNADDLGFSEGVNRGIVEAHEQGILTSASLMVRQPAAEAAVEVARRCPGLSIGLHVDLGEWVFDGASNQWVPQYEVLPPDQVESPAAVEREVQTQLAAFERLLGRKPTHLDSHQHLHRSDPLRAILLDLADRLGIPLRHYTPAVAFCGDFYGQLGRGEPYPQGIAVEHLTALVGALQPGVTELCCHPARGVDHRSVYATERELELVSLCDARVRNALAAHEVALVSFSNYKSR